MRADEAALCSSSSSWSSSILRPQLPELRVPLQRSRSPSQPTPLCRRRRLILIIILILIPYICNCSIRCILSEHLPPRSPLQHPASSLEPVISWFILPLSWACHRRCPSLPPPLLSPQACSAVISDKAVQQPAGKLSLLPARVSVGWAAGLPLSLWRMILWMKTEEMALGELLERLRTVTRSIGGWPQHTAEGAVRVSASNAEHMTNCIFSISAIGAMRLQGARHGFMAWQRAGKITVRFVIGCCWCLRPDRCCCLREIDRCFISSVRRCSVCHRNHLTLIVCQIRSFSEACLLTMRTDLVQKHRSQPSLTLMKPISCLASWSIYRILPVSTQPLW